MGIQGRWCNNGVGLTLLAGVIVRTMLLVFTYIITADNVSR